MEGEGEGADIVALKGGGGRVGCHRSLRPDPPHRTDVRGEVLLPGTNAFTQSAAATPCCTTWDPWGKAKRPQL